MDKTTFRYWRLLPKLESEFMTHYEVSIEQWAYNNKFEPKKVHDLLRRLIFGIGAPARGSLSGIAVELGVKPANWKNISPPYPSTPRRAARFFRRVGVSPRVWAVDNGLSPKTTRSLITGTVRDRTSEFAYASILLSLGHAPNPEQSKTPTLVQGHWVSKYAQARRVRYPEALSAGGARRLTLFSRKEVISIFKKEGLSMRDWAKDMGFDVELVFDVLSNAVSYKRDKNDLVGRVESALLLDGAPFIDHETFSLKLAHPAQRRLFKSTPIPSPAIPYSNVMGDHVFSPYQWASENEISQLTMRSLLTKGPKPGCADSFSAAVMFQSAPERRLRKIYGLSKHEIITHEMVLGFFKESMLSIAEWARACGYDRTVVKGVIFNMGVKHHGESHVVAQKLGLVHPTSHYLLSPLDIEEIDQLSRAEFDAYFKSIEIRSRDWMDINRAGIYSAECTGNVATQAKQLGLADNGK